MKNLKKIFLPFFAMAFIMTLFQWGKFYLFAGTYTIWQSHVITIVFTSLIASIVSMFMMNLTERIEKEKKELELRESKIRTLKITMFTVHHIVNNFLTRLQLIRVEAEEEGTISQESLEKLEKDISEVSEKLVALSEIEHPDSADDFSKFFPSDSHQHVSG